MVGWAGGPELVRGVDGMVDGMVDGATEVVAATLAVEMAAMPTEAPAAVTAIATAELTYRARRVPRCLWFMSANLGTPAVCQLCVC